MINILVCIYDEVADFFGAPIPVKTVQEGIRQFNHILQMEDSQYAMSPDDFRLYRIGSYDVTNGRIIAQEPQLLQKGTKPLSVL